MSSDSPTSRVAAAYRRIAEVGRPEIWIALRDETDALADAAQVERRLAAGDDLPLAGLVVAVKDNIDVAGLPTTAGCPEFAYRPCATAAAVERLQAAGAVVLGKANLDQFGTGLVGTRSPYGAVRNSRDPQLIAGGSSSGPAVAVGLGIADIGVGTDTAGSVRVPAALNGIAGVKPTLGIVPTHGVVPACASFDAVSVLAADVGLAATAAAVMAGPDARDPRSRAWPADLPLAAPDAPRVAIPTAANLSALSDGYRDAFERTVMRAAEAGLTVEPLDISILLDAALLLYDGAFVAERYDAVGKFLDTAPPGADPVVRQVITAARSVTGVAFAADLNALACARSAGARLLAGFDGLLLPTTTEHPTLDEVRAEPHAINRRLGTYTNFCNLLDMAAVAVPGEPTVRGTPFGVTVVVPAFHDQVAVDLAARLSGVAPALLVDKGCEVVVFDLDNFPRLEQFGGRHLGPVHTVLRRGELFRISEAGLGRLAAVLPTHSRMAGMEIADGRRVVGLIAEAQ